MSGRDLSASEQRIVPIRNSYQSGLSPILRVNDRQKGENTDADRQNGVTLGIRYVSSHDRRDATSPPPCITPMQMPQVYATAGQSLPNLGLRHNEKLLSNAYNMLRQILKHRS
jgi:hypothetical protein